MSLFGDLFSEEGSSSETTATHCVSAGPIPPSPRLPCNLCGIFNQGATCYLNSLLQTMMMTPEFRSALLSLEPTELGVLKEKDNPDARVRVIPIQLQRLFARLLLLNAQGSSTAELTDSFGWTNSEELQQHDVQELNRILFCAIEDSLIGTSGQDLIRSLYQGTIVNQTTCQSCGRVSEREEDFRDLCLTVAGMSSVLESLDSNYVHTELLHGANQYKCERCDTLVDAVKGAKIRSLPSILTLSLLRFSFDMQTFQRFKEIGKFTFPTVIDMAPYCESAQSDCDTEYELYSVVIHSGSTHGGHYRAYICDVDGFGKWTHPEDEPIVIPTDPSTGKVDFIQLDSPVDLVYAVLSRAPDGLTIDKLCAEIVKQTGVSWNKHYKRSYGPITKFVTKHDDRFEFNAAINLAKVRTTSNVPKVEEHGDTAPSQSSSGSAAKKSSASTPEPGQCWFNFDDSRVSPVKTQDLEKQFQGKESAYMLFYRRKSLEKSRAYTETDPASEVPHWLLEEVQEENIKLEKQRFVYEEKINTVHLQIHFAGFYDFILGKLTPKNDGCSFLELSIDRRKSVGELKHQIRELGGELAEGSFVMHLAHMTPGGFHLTEAVSTPEEDSILSSPITNNSRIFVWDGEQVGGHAVPTSREAEPISLQLTCNDGSPFSHAFPKNLTIGELRLKLEVISGIQVDNMQLSRVITKGEENKLVRIQSDLDPKTLGDLKVECGEHWFVEDPQLQESKITAAALAQKSSVVTVIVENRCCASPDKSWPCFPVACDKNASVAELKALAVSQVSMAPEVMECRLRVDDDSLGLRPPLHEQLSVMSAGISPGDLLVLEPGPSPQTTEITLNFNCEEASPDNGIQFPVEVMIDATAKVSDCLRVIINRAQLTGDDWHLRQTNWCGEPAKILDDLGMTLADCNLRDGELLLVEKGKLPPKGHLKLKIWLFPSAVETEEQSGSLLSAVTSGIQNLLGSSPESSTCAQTPTELGDIIISKTSALSDLKSQVMVLPSVEQLSIPSAEHLRLRLIEDKRLTQVLKGASQTLQRLKLASGMDLGVQTLSKPENLHLNQMLLCTCMKNPGVKTYGPPRDFLWDDSSGLSAAALRQRVSNLTSIPLAHLAIAKHLPHKFEWIVIKEVHGPSPKSSKHSRGKRKAHSKNNLKQAPFFLKDGDVIGVKDLREESGSSPLDFATLADEEGKAQLEKQAEEKRKQREEHRRNMTMSDLCATSSGQKRPEVGIKIHVADFS